MHDSSSSSTASIPIPVTSQSFAIQKESIQSPPVPFRNTFHSPSPVTLITPTRSTYYPRLSEPWNIPVRHTKLTIHSGHKHSTVLKPSQQSDEERETLAHSDASFSFESSIELLRMAPSDLMKRKVVIMGSPSVGESISSLCSKDIHCVVGKTSLTQQFISPPTYNESYFPTIEATSHKLVTFDGVDYECEIIDSAGQVSLSKLYRHWTGSFDTGRIYPFPLQIRRRSPRISSRVFHQFQTIV